MAVIEVTDLRKRYGDLAVLDGVSFSVEEGDIFGILGLNGAGKTTAVECVEGLRRPDGGSIRVLGLDPVKNRRALCEQVGVQLQHTQLPDNLKVWEALDLYASFYANPRDWRELLVDWGLEDKRDARFGKPDAVARRRPCAFAVRRRSRNWATSTSHTLRLVSSADMADASAAGSFRDPKRSCRYSTVGPNPYGAYLRTHRRHATTRRCSGTEASRTVRASLPKLTARNRTAIARVTAANIAVTAGRSS